MIFIFLVSVSVSVSEEHQNLISNYAAETVLENPMFYSKSIYRKGLYKKLQKYLKFIIAKYLNLITFLGILYG